MRQQGRDGECDLRQGDQGGGHPQHHEGAAIRAQLRAARAAAIPIEWMSIVLPISPLKRPPIRMRNAAIEHLSPRHYSCLMVG